MKRGRKIAAISLAEHPASATLRHVALREPWADRPGGKPAARHISRNKFVKPGALKGAPALVVKKVKCSAGLEDKTSYV
jgi:hypothetical protein